MSATLMSETTTHGVRVAASAVFNLGSSDLDARDFLFDYEITIENTGEQAAQLIARHWVIIDAHGRREDVRGQGVVGQSPKLAPGETFRYQSRCPLKTAWGTMEGEYLFRRDDGVTFQVKIGRFYLAMPREAAVAR